MTHTLPVTVYLIWQKNIKFVQVKNRKLITYCVLVTFKDWQLFLNPRKNSTTSVQHSTWFIFTHFSICQEFRQVIESHIQAKNNQLGFVCFFEVIWVKNPYFVQVYEKLSFHRPYLRISILSLLQLTVEA